MLRQLLYLAILFAITAVVVNFIFLLDLNKRVYNHAPGPCRKLKGIEHGGEDVALVDELGLGFISSGIFYMTPRPDYVKGNIFLHDFKKPNEEPTKLKLLGISKPELFRPHGLSHWLLPGGKVRIFAVNHAPPEFKHSVILFDFDEKEMVLRFVKSIEDDKLIRPNDIVATGPEEFIFTNDGSAQTDLTNVFEILLHLKAGSVGFYDGQKSHWLLEKAMSANGVALDRKGEHLFVSHINDETIGVYKITKDFKSLEHIRDVPLMTAADNLYVHHDGSLWTGAHPIFHSAVKHLSKCEDLSTIAPSQVIRLKFTKSDFSEWEISEPFADEGKLISASSVAVIYGDQLLVGSVCREAILCRIAE